MARYLGDINTRARGLRTHLLPASELERLARATSLLALQRELSGLGYVRSDAPATAVSLEKAIRRYAAGQMGILDRWCTDDRRAALAVIFEDEDRRSIQAILRGAQQGTATEARMAGLVPTTSPPRKSPADPRGPANADRRDSDVGALESPLRRPSGRRRQRAPSIAVRNRGRASAQRLRAEHRPALTKGGANSSNTSSKSST